MRATSLNAASQGFESAQPFRGSEPQSKHPRKHYAVRGELSGREAALLRAIAISRIGEEPKRLRSLFQFSKVSILKSNAQKIHEIEASKKQFSS